MKKSGGVKKTSRTKNLKSVVISIIKSVGTKVTDIYTLKYLLNVGEHEAENYRINNRC